MLTMNPANKIEIELKNGSNVTSASWLGIKAERIRPKVAEAFEIKIKIATKL